MYLQIKCLGWELCIFQIVGQMSWAIIEQSATWINKASKMYTLHLLTPLNLNVEAESESLA